jgi:tripartite-type tricarboxylate transporter receptor subunit TctC
MRTKPQKVVSLFLTVFMGISVFMACSTFSTVGAAKTAYPQKPIQVIVPTGSGGDTDINARLFCKYMKDVMGQPLVVTNVTGAGGVLGSRQVKDAAPDGYTVLFFHYGMLTQTITGVADFDLLKDFKVAAIPLIDNTSVIVAKKGRFHNMQGLIRAAKSQPGKIVFGMETGTVAHMIAYILDDLCGIELKKVDTGAAATRHAALLSGQSDVIFSPYVSIREYVESGDFEILGLIAEKRNPNLPKVKTLAEQGVKFALPKFFYFAFPKNTPDEVVNKFSKAMETVSKNKKVKNDFAKYLVQTTFIKGDKCNNMIDQTKELFKKYITRLMK